MPIEEKIKITNERLKTLRYSKEEETLTSRPRPTDYNKDRVEQIEDINKKLENMRNQVIGKDEVDESKSYEVCV